MGGIEMVSKKHKQKLIETEDFLLLAFFFLFCLRPYTVI